MFYSKQFSGVVGPNGTLLRDVLDDVRVEVGGLRLPDLQLPGSRIGAQERGQIGPVPLASASPGQTPRREDSSKCSTDLINFF